MNRLAQKSFDQNHKVGELPTLSLEDIAWIPDKQGQGRIEEQVNPRSYEV